MGRGRCWSPSQPWGAAPEGRDRTPRSILPRRVGQTSHGRRPPAPGGLLRENPHGWGAAAPARVGSRGSCAPRAGGYTYLHTRVHRRGKPSPALSLHPRWDTRLAHAWGAQKHRTRGAARREVPHGPPLSPAGRTTGVGPSCVPLWEKRRGLFPLPRPRSPAERPRPRSRPRVRSGEGGGRHPPGPGGARREPSPKCPQLAPRLPARRTDPEAERGVGSRASRRKLKPDFSM